MGLAEIWNAIILQPMLNCLIALSSYLYDNFGITIIVLTIIVRGVTLPLTMRQLRSTKAMSSLQPKIQELQKKYGKDQQALTQEMMKLYRTAGVNPMGCLWPMLIQLPIWIALYQSIIRALAVTPEDLLGLSQLLYSWPVVHQMIPLGENFLWLNLAQPDRYLILSILVGGTMWVQQKMLTSQSIDPRQQSMNRMMLWMMPMMFAFFTLQFPSGLALYWVASNLIGIAIQYYIGGGWGGLFSRSPSQQKVDKHMGKTVSIKGQEAVSPSLKRSYKQEKRAKYGKSRDKRKDSGGGN